MTPGREFPHRLSLTHLDYQLPLSVYIHPNVRGIAILIKKKRPFKVHNCNWTINLKATAGTSPALLVNIHHTTLRLLRRMILLPSAANEFGCLGLSARKIFQPSLHPWLRPDILHEGNPP
jgi:hypothetical protein